MQTYILNYLDKVKNYELTYLSRSNAVNNLNRIRKENIYHSIIVFWDTDIFTDFIIDAGQHYHNKYLPRCVLAFLFIFFSVSNDNN